MTTKEEKQARNKLIGQNIRFLREQREMSVEELAQRVNLSPVSLRLIEQGLRGITTQQLIAFQEALITTTDFLVTGKNDLSSQQRLNLMYSQLDEARRREVLDILAELLEHRPKNDQEP